MPNWTQAEAIELCRRIELFCPAHGCHVALTGGLLYKNGERKDLDILFYRIRQTPKIDMEELLIGLAELCKFEQITGFGWCYKATCGGKPVDMFFPEEQGNPEGYPGRELTESESKLLANDKHCIPLKD